MRGVPVCLPRTEEREQRQRGDRRVLVGAAGTVRRLALGVVDEERRGREAAVGVLVRRRRSLFRELYS